MKTIDAIIRESMSAYGNYVIHDRAVPGLEDGLKPVQRRLLWTMHKLGLVPTGNFTKSAKVIGYTTAHWHPHGDAACYDALVAMTHQRYPLVEGQGNFGTWTDSPAAMRYTEVRLTPLGHAMFECADVAPTQPNYLGESGEPVTLASRLPSLLVNGTEGIAVAVTCCVPPHNLKEVIGALRLLLRDNKATLKQVMRYIKGPDYEHGIITSKVSEIEDVYRSGKGTIHYRCHHTLTDTRLTVTSYAPHFNPTTFIQKCHAMVGVGDLLSVVDETSESNGVRIVVEHNNIDTVNKRVLPMLSTTVRYNFHTLTTGRDGASTLRSSGLVKMLRAFLAARRKTERAMLKLAAERARQKLLEAEALVKASGNMRLVAKALAGNKPVVDLAKGLKISKKQAQGVLRAPLTALSARGRAKALANAEKLSGRISRIEEQLADVNVVVANKLDRLAAFADDRKMDLGTSLP